MKPLTTFLLCTAVLYAAPAVAQSTEPGYLKVAKSVYISGVSIDWSSSAIGVRHGYEEGNPFLSGFDQQPNTFMAATAVVAVVNYLIWREIGKTNPKIATVGFLSIGVLQGSMGLSNLNLMVR